MVNGDMVLTVSSSLFLLLIVQCRITGLLGRDKRMPSLLQEIPSLRFLGFSDSALDHCITFLLRECIGGPCVQMHPHPYKSHGLSLIRVCSYVSR